MLLGVQEGLELKARTMFPARSFFVVNYSLVIRLLSHRKQMDSQSIKYISDYMFNSVVFDTE